MHNPVQPPSLDGRENCVRPAPGDLTKPEPVAFFKYPTGQHIINTSINIIPFFTNGETDEPKNDINNETQSIL